MAWYDNIVTEVKDAVIGKANSLISGHNSNASAHQSLFNGKSDVGHTHLVANVTDFDLDSIEDNLRYEILCFTDNSLSSECYNFDIDSTVYIVVNAFDVYGDSVSVGSSEVLSVNTVSGVSSLSGFQRVNYNGVETNLYVYSASEWGQCRFSIKTYDTFIRVNGRRTVYNTSPYTVFEYENHVGLQIDGGGITVPTSWTVLNTSAIPFRLRPISVVTSVNYNGSTNNIAVGVRPYNNKCDIMVKSLGSSQITNQSIYTYFEWSKAV